MRRFAFLVAQPIRCRQRLPAPTRRGATRSSRGPALGGSGRADARLTGLLSRSLRGAPLLALLIAGCAHAPPRAPGRVPVLSSARCGRFAGSESWRPNPDTAVREQLEGLVCFGVLDRGPTADARAYVVQHHRFDDRTFDPVVAALIVVGCAADGACAAGAEPESLGQVLHYAQDATPALVRKAVLALGLDREVQDAFLKRHELDRQWVLDQAKLLGPRETAIYVAVPEQVRARFKAHWKTFAPFYKRYDKLAPKVDAALADVGAPTKTLEALTADVRRLRDDYVLKCAKGKTLSAQECLLGPLARPLTDRLVRLAIATRQAVPAAAENTLLKLGLDQGTAAAQILTAQAAAVEAESSLREQYDTAREEGVDQPTLDDAYGSPPPVTLPPPAWEASRGGRGYRNALRNLAPAVDLVEGTVRGVKGKGDTLEVAFEDSRAADECDEGDDECAQAPGRRTDPVLLAAADARPLKPGNQVEVVVDRDTRKGLLVKAFRTRAGHEIVQVRSVRLER